MYTWDDPGADTTLSNADLTIEVPGASLRTSECHAGAKTSGKWYWEILIDANGYYCKCGITAADVPPSDSGYPGSTYDGIVHRGLGGGLQALTFNLISTLAPRLYAGDVVGFILDMDNGYLWITVNNVLVKAGDPTVPSGWSGYNITGSVWPCVSAYESGKCTAKFSASTQTYTPPAGFIALDQSTPTVQFQAFLDQPFDLLPEVLKQFLNQEYNLLYYLNTYLDQKYGNIIAIYLAMYYGDAPSIRNFLEQRYQGSLIVKAILDMPYENLLMLRAYLDQPYHLPQALIAMMEQKYGINEATFVSILEQKYDISTLNYIISLLNQVYGLQGDRNVDYINTVLTINGKITPIHAVSGECSLDNFCITIDVTLADYSDYLRIKIDDAAVFVNGADTYQMVVDSKQRSRPSVANTSYQVFLKSPRIDLQSPRSKTFAHEYSASNAETIVEGIIGEPVDWETVGFPILDNKLYANDETEIDIVRKVIRTVGAKLQSNPDGTLRVIPEYPISTNKWESPDYFMTDTIDFVSQSESFRHNTGFNRFVVRNESTPEDRIWVEQEVITAYKKKILAFQTPWDSEAVLELIHSGGAPVPAPVYHGVVEITQPAEQVEFVAGFSNTSRPIYGNLQVTWLRENLGSITFSEDGKLEAELKAGTTDGYSLAEVTYTTKYHLWHAEDLADENVQYILKEVNGE